MKNCTKYLLFAIALTSICSGFLFCQDLEINDIEFTYKGTRTIEESELEDAIALSKANVFTLKLLDEDIQKLKKFYFDNGFFEAEVDTALYINDEDEEIDIEFIIKENKRYRIDSITVKGISQTREETVRKLNSIKALKRGTYYNKSKVIQYTNEILDTLQNNGYMNARIRLDSGTIITKYSGPNEARVDIELRLDGADSLFYFGKTNVSMKNNIYGVSNDVILREITYKEGELYEKRKKLDSERNISTIAVVQSARIQNSNTEGGKADFSANVSISKKHELTPFIKGSEFDNKFYIGAGVKYLNKYLWSANRTLNMELEGMFHSISINRAVLSATVTQPHFINRKITLTDRVSIGFNNVENYKNYFAGNLTTLSYPLQEYTFYNTLFLDLTEEILWLKYDSIATGSTTLINSFLSFTAEHNDVNNPLSPSQGFYHSILAGHAGVLPSLLLKRINKNIVYSQFVKLYTLNKGYFSITGGKPYIILAAIIKIGDIIEYGSDKQLIPVQPVYKFFSGGSSSLRGWHAKQNGYLTNTLNGGKLLLEGSTELRFKLFPKADNFTRNIGAAVFFDFGNVWDSHKDFVPNRIAMAIGFGVRYDLFLGPIRLDIGFKLYDPSAPEEQQWLFGNMDKIFKNKFAVHLGIGQAF